MHLTLFHVTGDFNISDSTSSNTSDPCSYFFSSCLFFLDYISQQFHDLTERDIKMVFASIIWRHTAAVVHFKNVKNNVVIKLVLRALNKNNSFSPATTFSFTRKCLLKKSNLNKLKLTFRRWPTFRFHGVFTITFMWSECTRSGRKNVVHYK